MSNFYRGQSNHSVYGGIIIDVAEDSLDRVTKLLAGIKGGAYKAVGSALSRAASSGKTAAKRAVTEEYAISGSTFLSETKTINHFVKSGSSIEIVFYDISKTQLINIVTVLLKYFRLQKFYKYLQ